jgi:hypothetical protein
MFFLAILFDYLSDFFLLFLRALAGIESTVFDTSHGVGREGLVILALRKLHRQPCFYVSVPSWHLSQSWKALH